MNKIAVKACLFFVLTITFDQMSYGQEDLRSSAVLSELISTKSKMVKNSELGERYKVQLISGSTLEEANKIERKFKSLYPGYPVTIKYETPNYKVWAGEFVTKLEAERLFIQLRDEFKSAFVFKP
ncbi:SPOR domain-containing protein [Mesonia sp. K7]|uniref:SPOR domain-containing protein n=1 Tax=Mesonia sp. K7 TaxID=2218606 RepID=UPI000DA78694|nr:SPOR domain-containing protein [Mesonia sp. K7]PZD78777.1 SPOR domain-containing protein [Mesonia sp. K7]